ncbi:MAG: hypothetical protein ACR2IF_13795 [Terriglobales bacterium]
MSRRFKFVALVLSLAVLAAPAAALAGCWSGSGGRAAHACCGDGMDSQNPAAAMQAADSSLSCCDVSSGKPAPTAQLILPASGAHAAVTVPNSAVSPVPMLVAANEPPPGSTPPLPGDSPQAVLCTFLI